MKKIMLVFCAAMLAAAMPVTVSAQESNRDENGKIVRGPYQTNGFWDNWYIGVGGGVSTVYLPNADNLINPAFTVDVTKWLTPSFGLRAGYQGFNFKDDGITYNYHHYDLERDKNGNITQNYHYFHGDAILSITNLIWGYKENRFWNVDPYVHAGYICMYNPTAGYSYAHDPEFEAGPGLLNRFRLAKRVNLTLDVKDLIFSSRFQNYNEGRPANMLVGTIGLQVGLGKTNWHRFNTEIVAANAALAKAYDEIEALKNAPKEKEIIEVVKEIPAANPDGMELVPLALGVAPITLFFEINHTDLNVTERAHLDYYVKNILEKDPDRVFYLTGTADEGTGTQAINERLSMGRVKEVIRILKEEYGITPDRLVLKAAEIVNTNNDPRLDRSVIIEH